MTTKQIIGYVIVDKSTGETTVGEPVPTKDVMQLENEMRRLNKQGGTSRYAVKAVLA